MEQSPPPLTLETIQRLREEGAEISALEDSLGTPRRYILMAHEIFYNGMSGAVLEDPDVARDIGERTGLGAPTDPNGWAIWVVPDA
jgi:hypothetical protein